MGKQTGCSQEGVSFTVHPWLQTVQEVVFKKRGTVRERLGDRDTVSYFQQINNQRKKYFIEL
jgi:hypothetical protein